MVNTCVLYPASSTAFHYGVGNASHLEWIDSLGDCLISLCAMVRIILSLHLLLGMRMYCFLLTIPTHEWILLLTYVAFLV